jgi:hypothetical protein
MLGGEGRRKGKIWDRKEIAKALGSTDVIEGSRWAQGRLHGRVWVQLGFFF